MDIKRRSFLNKISAIGATASLSSLPFSLFANEKAEPIRIGIIGLDTSHSPAFTKLFNTESPKPELAGFRVVAAFPHGSQTIKSSYERIPGYIDQVKGLGVEICESIESMLDKVDVVLLETNDGNPRLEQARMVIEAKKPFFIDKPVAASFRDTQTIFQEAKTAGVPIFSASSLRYVSNAQAVRHEGKIGEVLGCDAFSPAVLEPSHPDLFWYGIHGVEILYTVMGPGCETVTRQSTGDADLVVGKWKDGRIGTFRGMRSGKHEYGGTAFGSEGNLVLGNYEGYEPLAAKIAEFFKTGKSPVSDQETLEIYAFMEAADESKRRGGASVALSEIIG
ncbi:Gfo/Idh/MocA family oxidoreductase [Algoriphagus aestuariicola]|uniref:Gfo/Idh/MocA family oxidoreductase n=1 Tax=Algoriphagus aestuariicola TaxID=1852016 RepID=A0ABS3BN63_9BACT|nr:Gfo/Idh/MocA family oxidoreductase [Algoriphagus aestuariicola]MBN7800739.1 Gfo/Idh/MocA family oxidoreductase [Algoriphagus aestuariicola]